MPHRRKSRKNNTNWLIGLGILGAVGLIAIFAMGKLTVGGTTSATSYSAPPLLHNKETIRWVDRKNQLREMIIERSVE